jgi:hypothetical protein
MPLGGIHIEEKVSFPLPNPIANPHPGKWITIYQDLRLSVYMYNSLEIAKKYIGHIKNLNDAGCKCRTEGENLNMC